MTATARIAVPAALDPRMLENWRPDLPVLSLSGRTMGTVWRVKATAPASIAETLHAAIVSRLDGLVAEMSHWVPTSNLMRFNRAEAGAWVALPRDFATVVATGLAIAEASGGLFDPAIGRVTDLWGFGPNPRGDIALSLAGARAASGWGRLALHGDRLRQPGGAWLDLSGIAKGYAADALADVLRAHDIGHALVEIGGECVGMGIRPDGDPWWVELETPPNLTLPPFRIALHNLAVATSGSYVRGLHTIDPRTGNPAQNTIVSASVIAADAMRADAWASALCAARDDEADALAERQNLTARIVRANGREWISTALHEMM